MIVITVNESSVKPPIISIHLKMVGLVKQTNTCFSQVNIGAKTQWLSKEIGVGVVIPCWRRSQLVVVTTAHNLFSSKIKKILKCPVSL